MELSPKQQTVELVKKAKRILVLGHKKPNGDMLGSLLALQQGLKNLDKTVEVIVSDNIPKNFNFLPHLSEIKSELKITEGKILRIDTEKFPVSGLKYQKTETSLDIILDSEKNLKFAFVEIINGDPKPDLIIVLDTAAVEKIDAVYDKETQMFFEVPVVNIDHHAGNEYFGTVNLVDLTATSTAEILVSLFEALGIKINTPEVATNLLTGIIVDTESFQSSTTTPKSLTVAAQLLASGGRQQEIIGNLYKTKSMKLMKLWEALNASLSKDEERQFAWAKVELAEKDIELNDIEEASRELLERNSNISLLLTVIQNSENKISGHLFSKDLEKLKELADKFKSEPKDNKVSFKIEKDNLIDAENWALLLISEVLNKGTEAKDVWEVIEKETKEELTAPETLKEVEETEELTKPETKAEIQAASEEKDIIDNAIHSIEQANKESSFKSIGEIIKKKQDRLPEIKQSKDEPARIDDNLGGDIDVFDEADE